MRKIFLLAILCGLISSFSFAGPLDHTCGTETIKGISFKYCYNQVDRSKTEDIIYFFHGLHGNEETWFTQSQGTVMISNYWRRRGYEPAVVTVSFGDAWLLVDNDRFALLPFFQNQIMPFLEAKVGGIRNGSRLLMGQSMGGFNASEASLQLPGYFKRVALMCPAISTIGPYSSSEDIASYIKRTHASPAYVRLLLAISKAIFTDQADWDRHDPLKLLALYPEQYPKPQYYVSTGTRDEFGFQEGSEIFVKTALQNNFEAQWQPVSGGHCMFDRFATARFIMGEKND